MTPRRMPSRISSIGAKGTIGFSSRFPSYCQKSWISLLVRRRFLVLRVPVSRLWNGSSNCFPTNFSETSRIGESRETRPNIAVRKIHPPLEGGAGWLPVEQETNLRSSFFLPDRCTSQPPPLHFPNAVHMRLPTRRKPGPVLRCTEASV